jgi:hypothetical protein
MNAWLIEFSTLTALILLVHLVHWWQIYLQEVKNKADKKGSIRPFIADYSYLHRKDLN